MNKLSKDYFGSQNKDSEAEIGNNISDSVYFLFNIGILTRKLNTVTCLQLLENGDVLLV